jgi:murein DD-endopeptidase MepM/ murein hydrolase activator NlpD
MLAGCAEAPPPAETPVSIPQPPAPPRATRYVVQSGDTLYSIAQIQGVDWRDIVGANPNVDWLSLRSGQVLFVPGGKTIAPSSEAPLPAVEMNPGHLGPIAAEGRFIWPLRGQVLASFGQPVPWRRHEPNSALEIAAGPGAAVVAAKSGRVNTFSHADDEGKMVILEHQDHTATCYGHLGEILAAHGTWVKQGEVIGTTGSSGRAHGAELSFRILENGRFVDPLPLLSR